MERAWAWLHATFPERQIYIRSDGRVQFFTFGPTLQATLAGLTLIFLAWVAFASVNVIFKDRIIAAKDHHYQQMQSAYENRLAKLQVSYDELNGALVSAEDTFKSTADQLEIKQRTMAHLLGRKDAVDHALADLGGHKPLPRGMPDPSPKPAADTTSDSNSKADDHLTAAAPAQAAPTQTINTNATTQSGSEIGVMPQPPAAQPRTAKPIVPTKASFLDGIVGTVAAFFFPPKARVPTPGRIAASPGFRMLRSQTRRLRQMSRADTGLLTLANKEITGKIKDIDKVLRTVGIKPSRFEQEADVREGGPFVPISDYHINGIADQAFTLAYADASAHVKELDDLFAAFRHVPLAAPVHGSEFELTSDFGPRIDPFTHRLGFHPGLDFGGPWGSIIHATAPGKVVFAGRREGYGNMVEIDHGFGIHTRYAHMSSILVRVGASVSKGTPIGRLGSTGRSTGPHVHYEIRVGEVARNPSKFIEAGRHVLQ